VVLASHVVTISLDTAVGYIFGRDDASRLPYLIKPFVPSTDVCYGGVFSGRGELHGAFSAKLPQASCMERKSQTILSTQLLMWAVPGKPPRIVVKHMGT
jgi:hypothetical protein